MLYRHSRILLQDWSRDHPSCESKIHPTYTGTRLTSQRIALFFSQLSPKPEDRERAQNILIKSGDFGAKWLKGGWKDEPDADSLGLDIGAGWIETATEGIEKVVEGISMAQW